MHAVAQFDFQTVTVSAKSVGGSTPGARVTWNTTVPPGCVTSVRVEFRRTDIHGPLIETYTTTNTSQTEMIQADLRCSTNYYIRVVVTGEVRPPCSMPTTRMLSSGPKVQVLVEGKETVCMFNFSHS